MNTTRRHPRTLQEAFGPYTSRQIEEQPRPRTHWFSWVLAIALLLLLFAAVLRHPSP